MALAASAPSAPQYPVIYTLDYPQRQSRWKAGLRLLLALPELLALLVAYWLLYPLALASWLIIVFSGRLDRTIWGFSVAVLRWIAAVLSYVTLLRDEYPGAGRRLPQRFEISYPARRSRVRTLFRLVLILPQLYVAELLILPIAVGAIIAWFAIVIAGRYPEGVWRLEAGLNRWILRVAAYALLLRDDYPPYTLGLWEPATLAALGVATEPAAGDGAPAIAEAEAIEPAGGPAGIPIWPHRGELDFFARPTDETQPASSAEPPGETVAPSDAAEFFVPPPAVTKAEPPDRPDEPPYTGPGEPDGAP